LGVNTFFHSASVFAFGRGFEGLLCALLNWYPQKAIRSTIAKMFTAFFIIKIGFMGF